MPSFAVQVDQLSFRYGERVALQDLSFSVPAGEILGLVGPNGCGKSTLLKILATLLPVQSGRVLVGECDLHREPDGVRRQIGVTFQSPSLDLKLTVRENLKHQGHLYGLSGSELTTALNRVLEAVRLSDRSDDRVETLSGGLKRRVEIAKCLLHRPRVLLLDEPTTGLDPSARQDFWRALLELRDQRGLTILVTSHLREEADQCDRLLVLEQGRLISEGVTSEDQPPRPRLIATPTVIDAAGNKPKRIEEFVGRINSLDDRVSVARMVSPEGWREPGQCPEFREITLVLRGAVNVEFIGGELTVMAGQAVITEPGQWVRYSTPGEEGAEYIAICLPAFSPSAVHRDSEGD